MPIPPYLWLKDDGGADIKGSVDVQDREGSIEVISMGHGVNLPVDTANGKITEHANIHHLILKKKSTVPVPISTKQQLQGKH